MRRGRSRALYRGRGVRRREQREFKRRYGRRGAAVYGAVIGKTKREQAERAGGELREHIQTHEATSDRGRRFRVRGHYATVHAHLHGRGDHPGPCSRACRRGTQSHRHSGRRVRRRR